jgi:hypothetical protein
MNRASQTMKSFLIFIVLSCAFIRTPWADELKVGPVYIDGPGEITTLVEVHSEGIPLASDFKLVLDKRSVTAAKDLKTFDSSGKELALIVCIDVGGSIGKELFEGIRAALIYFIGMAAERPNDRIALISFGDDIHTLASFEQSRGQFVDAVLKLQTSGSHTRLYDALNESLDLINSQGLPKRRRIIIISAGKDEGSIQTLENITAKAKALKVPIDAVCNGEIGPIFQQCLGKITESVGGQLIEANQEVSLRDRIKRLYLGFLEARSFMVYFSYEVELADGETEAAFIEMNRPGKRPIVVAISGKYPRPKRSVDKTPEVKKPLLPAVKHESLPPTFRNQTWLDRTWILLAIIAFIVLSIIVFILVCYLKKTGQSDRPGKGIDSGNEFPPQGIIPPHDIAPAGGAIPLAAPPRKTLVGGYLYPFPKPDNPCAELIGVEGPLKGTRHGITKELWTIGRSEENDLCIPDDDNISRRHAYLRYEKGSLFVFGNNSKSGTFVNKKKVLDIGVVLEPGDRIHFGRSILEVHKYAPNRINGTPAL